MPKTTKPKAKAPSKKELEAKSAEALAKQTATIVEKLDAGDAVHPYTILPTPKVEINHTVVKVQDLGDGRTLCMYKDA